jgi:large subunit ribosomal protein L32e
MEEGEYRLKIRNLRARWRSVKPQFLRYKWQRYFRLERQETWRRARGIDNKIRQKKRGYPPRVTTGYRSPKAIRGFHPSGLKPVHVRTISDLTELDKLKSRVILYISAEVGLNKKLQILKKASEMGFRVANGV